MAQKSKKKAAPDTGQTRWPYGKKNYLAFAIAVLVIVIGYIALGQGSITLAPILLVLGYCVLIPIALLIRGRPGNAGTEKQPDEAGAGH